MAMRANWRMWLRRRGLIIGGNCESIGLSLLLTVFLLFLYFVRL
ncbi:hypothetical protein MtrunA17_Chr8g0391351 [Medicago truncatula]|uniref:Transmembrane protein n=1 Tax=Medicago truncatula TaxID=3880 RepID=A0A396GRI0_MEDTR|nr:hypothetical protein MtrunA17_Chr8g0391351 [Medicago truncatula]